MGDKTLHPFCAFLLHPRRRVGVSAQGKTGSGMAKILLHGLDVVPGAETVYGIGVPLRYNNDKPEKSRIFKGFQGFEPDF